jgi:cobalt-zinc-cadmium efflux system protein
MVAQHDPRRPQERNGGHQHHHHPLDASDSRLRWALSLIAGFMGVEVMAGLWSGSLALLADAGHMLTDAASLALALYAAAASRRPADARRTYGYGRARVLAAFLNGLSLLFIAAWIAAEAAQRLFEPLPVLAGPMLAVACAGLAVNLIAYWILRGGSDLNTRGAMAHVLGDLLGSVAAIAAAGIILATDWTPADPLLSLAVAALIVRTGWFITKEAAHALLEGIPAGFDPQLMKQSLMEAVPDVHDVHHIHAWTVAPDTAFITLHVRVARATLPDAITAAVSRHLAARFGYRHATVQVECENCAEPNH